MATLKLGLGGKATSNPNYSMYPQVEDPNLRNFAQHKARGIVYLNRVLDFNPVSGDLAMQAYAKATLVGGNFAVGDIIELDQIISPSILVATFAQVLVPEAGFSFLLKDRAGVIAASVPTIVGGTAGTLMSPAGPTLKNYLANSMLQLEVSAGAAFPTKLKLSVGAIFLDIDARPL